MLIARDSFGKGCFNHQWEDGWETSGTSSKSLVRSWFAHPDAHVLDHFGGHPFFFRHTHHHSPMENWGSNRMTLEDLLAYWVLLSELLTWLKLGHRWFEGWCAWTCIADIEWSITDLTDLRYMIIIVIWNSYTTGLYLAILLSRFLSMCLSIYLSIYLSVCLSVCLFVYLFVHPFI